MIDDAPAHRRRSLRLKGYDYAQAGAYFVTICTQDRTCLFGEAVDDCMRLNDAGEMMAEVWTRLSVQFADVEIDAFVVMPNHLHGIIVLPDRDVVGNAADHVGAPLVDARDPSIGKRATTRVAPTMGDVATPVRVAPTN
jgi:putative transposase